MKSLREILSIMISFALIITAIIVLLYFFVSV